LPKFIDSIIFLQHRFGRFNHAKSSVVCSRVNEGLGTGIYKQQNAEKNNYELFHDYFVYNLIIDELAGKLR